MLKKVVIVVPKSLDEAAEFLAQIGKEQRATDTIQSDLNAKVDELKVKAMFNTKLHQKKISQLVEGLFAYAEVHRNELTDGGKSKTVKLPTGWFGWRWTPPAISIRNVKAILVKFKELGLKQFIRIKEEPNKEAMLKEPEIAKTIKGVSISQHEEFVVKPAELELEIVSNVDKLKKSVS